MILFSSFNHPIILLLFVYTGLVSGLIFTGISNICAFFVSKLKTSPQKAQKSNFKSINKQIHKKYKYISKRGKNRAQNIIKTDFAKKFLVLKNKISKMIQKTSVGLLKSIKIFVFCVLVILTYLINLKFNLGYLRLIFVLIWVGFFFVGKSLFNLLANYFCCFYNWGIKRMKKRWKSKTIKTSEKQNF